MEPPPLRHLVRAGALAALLSGLPSTLRAWLTGGDPLAATRAAGTMVPGSRPSVPRGALVHLGISAMWTAVLGLAAPRWRPGAATGAIAGAGIAALDLALLSRRWPAVRALPQGPQWADHIVFGAVVGAGLRHQPGQP